MHALIGAHAIRPCLPSRGTSYPCLAPPRALLAKPGAELGARKTATLQGEAARGAARINQGVRLKGPWEG